MDLEVEPGDTVARLKRMIEQWIGLPSEHTMVMFEGQRLEDRRTMSHYNIRDNANVYLTLQI